MSRESMNAASRAALASLTACSQNLDPKPLIQAALEETDDEEQAAAMFINIYAQTLHYAHVLLVELEHRTGTPVEKLLTEIGRQQEIKMNGETND